MTGVIWENELHREASQRVFLGQRVNEFFCGGEIIGVIRVIRGHFIFLNKRKRSAAAE